MQPGGDLINADTLTSGDGTLVFAGAADQTFKPGAATVGALTVANTGVCLLQVRQGARQQTLKLMRE